MPFKDAHTRKHSKSPHLLIQRQPNPQPEESASTNQLEGIPNRRPMMHVPPSPPATTNSTTPPPPSSTNPWEYQNSGQYSSLNLYSFLTHSLSTPQCTSSSSSLPLFTASSPVSPPPPPHFRQQIRAYCRDHSEYYDRYADIFKKFNTAQNNSDEELAKSTDPVSARQCKKSVENVKSTGDQFTTGIHSTTDSNARNTSSDDVCESMHSTLSCDPSGHSLNHAPNSSTNHAPQLTHWTPSSGARMVDVAAKPPTRRVARAVGHVTICPAAYALLRANESDRRVNSSIDDVEVEGEEGGHAGEGKPVSSSDNLFNNSAAKGGEDGTKLRYKGDVLTVAQVAGIQAAKMTSGLIPLCHQVALTSCRVHLHLSRSRVDIEATAECQGVTGVEMEALTAVSVAALTVYDMLKSASKRMVIGEIRLVEKTGGKADFKL